MPTQLFSRDLRAGDILLQVSHGSVTNRLIEFGQSVTGGKNASIIHAGILFDPHYIIECSAKGLVAADLRVADKDYGYLVFRCHDRDLAQGAATTSKMLFDVHAHGKNLAYSYFGALASIFRRAGKADSTSGLDARMETLLQGRSHPFFCSQFVVFAYQFAGEQGGAHAANLFPFSDARISPSALAASLHTHRLFGEAGYLLPGER